MWFCSINLLFYLILIFKSSKLKHFTILILLNSIVKLFVKA